MRYIWVHDIAAKFTKEMANFQLNAQDNTKKE